jgi:periplasmic divalent cation tolerance protein
MRTLLVITTLPDHEAAVKTGKRLIKGCLAACVHIVPAGTSIYRWQGKVEEASEITMFIKTTEARYAELEVAIRRLHPYELPELIAFPIARGNADYLKWIVDETN